MKTILLALMFMTSLNSFAMTVVVENENGFDQYISYKWEPTCEKAEENALASSMSECMARTGSEVSCVKSLLSSTPKTIDQHVGWSCNIFCQINLRPTPKFKKVKGCEAKAIVLDLKK